MNIKTMWLDTRTLKKDTMADYISLAMENGYLGVLLDPSMAEYSKMIPNNVEIMLWTEHKKINECKKIAEEDSNHKYSLVIGSSEKVNEDNLEDYDIIPYVMVNDKEMLDHAVKISGQFSTVIIEFLSATNIPLELVLAFSQKNNCRICKKVKVSNDGWIAAMVMEMGCHTVLLDPCETNDILLLKNKIEELNTNILNLEELSVIEIKHIGMGDRVCIDTTSLLAQNEGMILGSTSNGGILVSSETHYLPYMELRPFRVNAGALHMYIWNVDGTTSYLSELKAGSQIMSVCSNGEMRNVSVGRIKMERRPMLLIRAKNQDDVEVNTIVQDDWHVRILGAEGNPMNCTELKCGDIVLGYTCVGGRHVGIKIDENIIEK